MEFHISRAARDRYDFDQSLYQFTGNAVFADLRAVREFAQRMNDRRDAAHNPDRAVRAGELNAMGLIDELLHLVVRLYDEALRQRGQMPSHRRSFSDALDYASQKLGPEAVYATLARFTEHFPPLPVYRREMNPATYLVAYSTDALEELMMLWLENENPAFRPFAELFDDAPVADGTAYHQLIAAIREFFDQQPRFGPDDQTLIEMLQAPARAAPDSLQGQLEFIRQRWAPYFGEAFSRFLTRLLTSFDLIREDEKAAFGFGGPGPSRAPTIEDLRGINAAPSGDITVIEREAFTPDTDWMPRLVLLAKNTYVWLDQLSRKYQRAITRLDQVPDEELAQMAEWGITGLWLIGLWERSKASQRIKQLMGAHDAVASAYSLYDYTIAEDLGGEAALNHLKAQAWRYGIRLASDMVPNHMGIDSKWVIERPDYFLSLAHPPFPSYTFDGPDLSSDPRVGIFLEDHYYTRTDAAVVFKRLDRQTGDVRYIYHGNDGTSFPWNDTAQINYLNPEAREAVIQTILHVARQFPIIRFDAAMTLAKRHIRRLWFPEPGAGGAIPSRAGHGLTAAEFDALMPNEFWREVVDRAAVEAPDTLLLAEAFWMLEGYFVRTLGMHRVYNSAFMNMLRDEKNGEYRQLIKNTLEFDPEILRRYVNFQNNPDEKTAVEQFGKGDKYFGVCVLMCTMPGLPMFGHGQIEGYTEKYGMEFRYPKLWEWPDQALVARHEREIFPLLKKRYLFAGVDRFRLFDFYTADGSVNEDVFAYSNAYGDEKTLVIYHNKFAETRGWIHTSAAYAVKPADKKVLVRSTLGEALGLHDDAEHFVVFHDAISGLEFIRSSRELCARGLHMALRAYEYHVFDRINEVREDAAHPYAELDARLQGRWVASISEELEIVRLTPVARAYRRLVDADLMKRLMGAATLAEAEREQALDDLEARMQAVLEAIQRHTRGEDAVDAEAGRAVARAARKDARRFMALRTLGRLPDDEATLATTLGWLLSRRMGEAAQTLLEATRPVQDGTPRSTADPAQASRIWLTRWRLGEALHDALRELGMDDPQAYVAVAQVKLVLTHSDLLMLPAQVRPPESSAAALAPNSSPRIAALRALFADPEAQALLQVNVYDGITYFSKEAFESLVAVLEAAATLNGADDARARAQALIEAATAAGYRVAQLLSESAAPDAQPASRRGTASPMAS
ncbi:alpha-amylase family glycosyl hydrolase [Candidatus Roseilinea sp. NK_OTU-006]|jgi:glycosidase|uniref:alpha-amylase family glycosyl hydrolase n=1 Tax=Candidatus Roseilinea sp. NK_OTU-006 TaxID=2704250 RepID=UPI00145C77F1|nr:alpha-amylase family glycosyl hydrolase [Candidatus Roseilinea sp. NK_OTU-006]